MGISLPKRRSKKKKAVPSVGPAALRKFVNAVYREIDPGNFEDHPALTGEEPRMPDPGKYVCAHDFGRQYLLYNAFRKREFNFDGSELDVKLLEQEAVTAFLGNEQRLSDINRTWSFQGSAQLMVADATPSAVLSLAKRKIYDLLTEHFDLDIWIDSCEFSAGASTRLKRRDAHPSNKYTGPLDVTREAEHLGVLVIKWFERWDSHIRDLMRESGASDWTSFAVRQVKGSVYFTVPKTHKSRRGACKEPELNMFMQKGIGKMIRRLLRRVGIDLDDQSKNAELARIGSIFGELVTIDLEAASDSVARGLVEWLLPPEWFRFIDMTRSHYVQLPDGSHHYLEKISSMGNGFTFELESLIFWAITTAAMELSRSSDRRHAIYGDDIICPTACSGLVVASLEHAGFIVNQEKSWLDGPFRESCGSHYFHGVCVTPFYIKENPTVSPGATYHVLNQLRSNPHTSREGLWRWALKLLTQREPLFVPASDGSRAGVQIREGDVPVGTYFCFNRQRYVYQKWHERSVLAYSGRRGTAREIGGALLYQLHGNISSCDWFDPTNRPDFKDYDGIPTSERYRSCEFKRATSVVWDELPLVTAPSLTL